MALADPLPFAVHSLFAKAVEVDSKGTYTLNGRDRIPLGAPIFAAATMEECEAWRTERLHG